MLNWKTCLFIIWDFYGVSSSIFKGISFDIFQSSKVSGFQFFFQQNGEGGWGVYAGIVTTSPVGLTVSQTGLHSPQTQHCWCGTNASKAQKQVRLAWMKKTSLSKNILSIDGIKRYQRNCGISNSILKVAVVKFWPLGSFRSWPIDFLVFSSYTWQETCQMPFETHHNLNTALIYTHSHTAINTQPWKWRLLFNYVEKVFVAI